MKFKLTTILCAVCCLLLPACKTDNTSTGESLLDDSSLIRVFSDTLEVSTNHYSCDRIITSPDSFLLGEMETSFGSLKADILTQFACPVGYHYPEGAVADSLVLYLGYNSWTGDDKTPLELDVWHLDKNPLDYDRRYYSSDPVSSFCSQHDSTRILDSHQLVVPAKTQDVSSNMHVVAIPVKDHFRDVFFRRQRFDSQETFNQDFPGLYITSTFGGSAMLNIAQVQLVMYYHFTYNKAGVDTTVYDTKGFYANSEVRQLNHIEYLENKAGSPISLLDKINALDEDNNYVVAPAGIYTEVKVPVAELLEGLFYRVGIERRAYLNLAQLGFEVLNVRNAADDKNSSDVWAQPSKNMLLIKKNVFENYFSATTRAEMDTAAIVGTLASQTDELGIVHYQYNYDLSHILTKEMRAWEENPFLVPDTLSMLLIPIDVKTNTNNNGSSNIVDIRESQNVSTTIIQCTHMKMVYSRF